MMQPMNEREDRDDGRAPICPACGVTALPAETSNVIDSGFVCENAECEGFGDPVPQ
jgi:hypothetical protein